MKRIKNILLVLPILAIVAIFTGITQVHAAGLSGDSHISSSNKTGHVAENVSNMCGSGGRYPILWITRTAQASDVITGYKRNSNGSLASQSITLKNTSTEHKINQVSFISINSLSGYRVLNHGWNWGFNGCSSTGISNGAWKQTWVDWSYLDDMRQSAAEGYAINSQTWIDYSIRSSYMLPDNMVSRIKELGGSVLGGHHNMLYYQKDDYNCQRNKYSTSCKWYDLITDGPNYWQPKSRTIDKTVLIKSYCKTGEGCIPFDYSKWTDAKLWKEAPTSATYSYISKENEFEYHHNLTYTLVTIRFHETWEEHENGSTRNYKSWYTRGSEVTDSKKADWHIEKPVLNTKYYKPYDLYTEQQIPQEDANKIFSGDRLKYLVNDKLDLVVDNLINQDMSVPKDQMNLTTIDDNGRLVWDLKFNNDQFGIPTAAQGGLDIGKNHKTVGELGLNITQYYNPELHSSSSKITNDNSSLEFKGKELKGNSEIIQYYGDRGGRYTFRSIKTGTYKISSKIFEDYWSVKYQAAQYFKYGSRYDGTVTISGKKLVWSPLENNKIKVVDNKIYTGEVTGTFIQPILRGTIVVKTVGGYNP